MIIWSVIVLYLIIVLVFVSGRHNEILCSSVDIEIVDNSNNRFVTDEDISDILRQKLGIDRLFPINSLNISEFKEQLLEHPAIAKTEISRIIHKTDSTINGEIKIQIEQRIPILRIFTNNNESFYIDENGRLMPTFNSYSARVLVASGNIDSLLTNDDTLHLLNNQKYKDIFQLAQFINGDKFWKPQIVQLYVNENNEFELIPRVGAHRIYLGDISNYKKKFKKLKTVYKKGFRHLGWTKYKSINLKFKNQVVCERKKWK